MNQKRECGFRYFFLIKHNACLGKTQIHDTSGFSTSTNSAESMVKSKKTVPIICTSTYSLLVSIQMCGDIQIDLNEFYE
jgi:hypothetical protein